tara:strand:- start:610 stop:1110 length:501 start_codon:yes stop_codon:yes gene_type:complete
MRKFILISFSILFFSCSQDISKSENEIIIERNNSIVTKNFQAYNTGNFEVFKSTLSDNFTFTLNGELDISGTYSYDQLLEAAGGFQSLLKNGWKGNVDKIISGTNGSVIVLTGEAEGVNGTYNNDYIWLYSINDQGQISSITEYLSDLLFVKQLYGQKICGEKKLL